MESAADGFWDDAARGRDNMQVVTLHAIFWVTHKVAESRVFEPGRVPENAPNARKWIRSKLALSHSQTFTRRSDRRNYIKHHPRFDPFLLVWQEMNSAKATLQEASQVPRKALPLEPLILSIRCILGDIRLWVGDPSTSSCLVSLPQP